MLREGKGTRNCRTFVSENPHFRNSTTLELNTKHEFYCDALILLKINNFSDKDEEFLTTFFMNLLKISSDTPTVKYKRNIAIAFVLYHISTATERATLPPDNTSMYENNIF